MLKIKVLDDLIAGLVLKQDEVPIQVVPAGVVSIPGSRCKNSGKDPLRVARGKILRLNFIMSLDLHF